jgi:putative peptide zinc metalloprotease protein
MESDPDQALTQEEVVHLLGQLNLSNLLHYDRSASAASLFERYKQRRKKEKLSKWMGIMSLKIPLFDPDALLNRLRAPIGVLFSPWGVSAYVVLLLAALVAVINNADYLFVQSQGILAPGNLILLYTGFLIAKLVHEFGHAAACKYFGGEVHTVGVMLLILAPVPFVDATATWGFRSRRHRMLVGFAGGGPTASRGTSSEYAGHQGGRAGCKPPTEEAPAGLGGQRVCAGASGGQCWRLPAAHRVAHTDYGWMSGRVSR